MDLGAKEVVLSTRAEQVLSDLESSNDPKLRAVARLFEPMDRFFIRIVFTAKW